MKNKKLQYVFLGFLFWFIVDWATVKGFHLSYFNVSWAGHIQRIIVFLLYPAIFSYVIFNRKWGWQKLLALTIVLAFAIEIVLIKNAILYTFPHFIIFIPAAIGLYGFLTFLPLWIVNKEVKQNKKKLAFLLIMLVILVAITILSFYTQA